MSVLYVKEQGASVQKLGERIIVKKNSQTLFDIPVFQLDNVTVIGNVQITTQALHMLLKSGIDVSFFTYSGVYLGNAAAEASKNIFLRFEQYGFYLDFEKRLAMARNIVNNKIGNQISVIQHFNWENKYDFGDDVEKMKSLQKLLDKKNTPNEILGVEGMASNIYFGVFGHMLKCEFKFTGRNRRPPRDPVNVIISLAYTFLTKEVCNALDSESFETYLGFLHGIRYGRKSLALDIVEEFRQPCVDRLVLMLFNKKMIGPLDFEYPEEGKVILNEDGFKKFCVRYEKWMSGIDPMSGENSFRKRIREQIAQLKRTMRNGDIYRPYKWEEHYVSH